VIIENFNIKDSQKACAGVVLTLRRQDPTTPMEVIIIDHCLHGINHPEANGDFLKLSCRKIQVMIQDEASIQYFKNFLFIYFLYVVLLMLIKVY
jgi:hypothetical protein